MDAHHVEQALTSVIDPDLGIDIVALGLVEDVVCEPTHISVRIRPTSPGCPAKEQIRAEAEHALVAAFSDRTISVSLAQERPIDETLRPWPVLAAPLAVLTLVLGTLGGLVRLGWAVPAPATAVGAHGPLMAVGFFGTVIALERAVALRSGPSRIAPVLIGAGAIGLLAGVSAAAWLMVAGGLCMAAGMAAATWEHRSPELAAGTAGALSMTAGVLLWALGLPASVVAWLWAAFLVVTVAGERLELAALLEKRPSSGRELGACSALLLGGAALAAAAPSLGQPVVGAGLLAIGGWLLLRDPGWRGLARPGAPRIAGLAMLAGQGWLVVAGLLLVTQAPLAGGPAYDAALHAVFLGFAVSMVFAHAPTIVPALTGVAVRSHRGLYLPLALLHAGLIWRALPAATGFGDRAVGGLLTALALALYPLLLAPTALVRARTSR